MEGKFAGIYKVPYSLPLLGMSLSSMLGKYIKFWRRGRLYQGFVDKYDVEKKSKQYPLPFNINAVGKNVKRGMVIEDLGKKIKIK